MLEGVARTKTCTNYKPKHHTVSRTDWSPSRRVLHHISIPPNTSRREPVKLGELCWYTDVYRIYKQCRKTYKSSFNIQWLPRSKLHVHIWRIFPLLKI